MSSSSLLSSSSSSPSPWTTDACIQIMEFMTLKWIVSNLIVSILHIQMLSDRISKLQILASLIIQEFILFLSSIYFQADSPANVVFLWISVFVYERLRGDKLEIRDNLSFASDLPNQFFKDCESVGAWIDSGKLKTDLKCLIVWKNGCSLPQGSLPLDIISSVNADVQQDNLVENLNKMGFQANSCFHVTTNDETIKTSLDLIMVAKDEEMRNKWVNILRTWLGLLDEDVQRIWLRKLLRLEDEDLEKKFTIDDALMVASQTRTNINPIYLLHLFESFSQSNNRNTKLKQSIGSIKNKLWKDEKIESKVKLDWMKFSEFFKAFVTPTAVETIFKKIPGRRRKLNILPAKYFQSFLSEVQKERIEADRYLEEINRIEPILNYSNVSVLGLSNYLLEEEHSIFNHLLMDSMDQPLSHYYIASSHNTYLTKDQLKSKSSVDMYVRALQRGCKCLELDCWDGSDNEPVIYHGFTLTSKILFKDVIVAIRDYAFVRSQYPVILSLEIHCSIEQQKIMVKHFKEILGDMLYLKQIPADECHLPSPNDLKGFILIKAKKIADGLDEGFIEDLDGDLSDEELDFTELNIMRELDDQREADSSDILSLCSLSDDEEVNPKDRNRNKLQALLNDYNNVPDNLNQKGKNKKARKIAKELSDLVVYCQSKRFKSFDSSRIEDGHFEMCSMPEKKALKLAKETSQDFIKHNWRHLTRVYPSGYRIDSSNYNPVHFWNVGCQLVALNYQTACKEMQLNQGLFQMNEYCGYVLKPQFLIQEESMFDPQVVPKHCMTISIRIISGHQLPFKNSNSVRNERNYIVQTRIYGVEADCQTQQTLPVKNNGLNPSWDEEFQFKIHVPELAILLFTVFSKAFIAQYSLPIRSLRRGWRRVPLLNKHSEVIKESFLLVQINHD